MDVIVSLVAIGAAEAVIVFVAIRTRRRS